MKKIEVQMAIDLLGGMLRDDATLTVSERRELMLEHCLYCIHDGEDRGYTDEELADFYAEFSIDS